MDFYGSYHLFQGQLLLMNRKSVNLLPHIFPVTCHSDHVGPGSTFVAIKGMKEDGTRYVRQALSRGAQCIVMHDQCVDVELEREIENCGARCVRAPDTRAALAQLSAEAWGWPARKLKIIAVTGTKGKSTTAFLIEHILRKAGYATALISSVKNSIRDNDMVASLTTEQPDYLHAFFHCCLEQHVEWVVMEVAAQAVTLQRVVGITFDMLVFTNFSREHGEFYATIEDYFSAKAALLEQLKPGGALILNNDDDRVSLLLSSSTQMYRFSLKKRSCDLMVRIVSDLLESGLQIELLYTEKISTVRNSFLIGTFNAYNIAAAYLCASLAGISSLQICSSLELFTGVPGRLERYIMPNGACIFIDHAHNPSSFQALFSSMRLYTDHLIVVFGCGGERDVGRRPLMGALASSIADVVIITTDNPRSEDPSAIVEDIMEGVIPEQRYKVIREQDRTVAIKHAYALSQPTSIILLVGKGCDEYQMVQEVKYHFSEREIVQQLSESNCLYKAANISNL
jgi:UDP-N-acetylmuramoyl-L-alanyl-D-glutamate--2,6-diaminopimelate ligase